MITNTKTIAVSVIAIAAVIALFAATPFVVAHQAQAFRGGWGGGFHRGGFGFHRGFGGGFGGFGGWRRLAAAGAGWRRLRRLLWRMWLRRRAAGGGLVKQSPPLFLFFNENVN